MRVFAFSFPSSIFPPASEWLSSGRVVRARPRFFICWRVFSFLARDWYKSEKRNARRDDFTRRAFRISNLGLVFQDFRLIEYLNARENMLLPYRLGAELRLQESVLDRMRILAERLRVSGLLDSPVKRLSQGERQRVAIGRALLVRPGMILADEPTGNLDPSDKQRIMDLLFDQALELEATLIVVTHDHALLDRFDRVVDFDRIGEREVDRV